MSKHYEPEKILGKPTPYLTTYTPSILQAIPRDVTRSHSGNDIWNAYEFSWLDMVGKPEQRLIQFIIPASSPYIVESKSLKLYLYGFSGMHYETEDKVLTLIKKDLQKIVGVDVSVSFHIEFPIREFEGLCLDSISPQLSSVCPDASLLKIETDYYAESVYSHVFKSHCPVTNQPDWASIWIRYSGSRINHTSLLSYLVSYRTHQGFHESCIEAIFCDILAHCNCDSLTVYGGFTRRGGIDINPYRSTEKECVLSYMRTNRQ